MPRAAGLWYEWHGPEAGEVVILSPGLGGSAEYWTPNLAGLSEQYRLLLYDHRGTGRSDRDLPEEVDIAGMAQDLLALIDALGIARAHLVGHAAGGLIGLALAAAPSRIAGLVVVNGWATLDPYTARCFDVRMALLRGSGPQAYLRAQPIFLYPPEWVSAHDDELDRAAARQLADFPGLETVEKRVAALRGFDAGALPGRISTPVLVLAAADDALVPASCSERLAAGLADATLMSMTGGHACNVTQADRFDEIVTAWLAGVPSKGIS